MTRCAGRLLFTLLPTLLISTAQAQRSPNSRVLVRPEVGVHIGRQFHDGSWIAGGYFRMPLRGAIDFRASGDVVPGSLANYQLNGDLALHGARDMAYLGGGVAWVHRDFASDRESGTGYNVFIGFKPFPRPGAQLYLEARLTRVEGISLFRAIIGGAFQL